MRLPWVSRAAFDLSQRNNEALHRLVKEHADERYDRLLTMYHEICLRVVNQPVAANGDSLGTPSLPLTSAPLPPIDPAVELWLDAKFVRGTPLWKMQYREAMKLKAEGVDSERIIETLGKGQAVEF